MSYDDDPRSRDRGAYTPPTEDDLPFRRDFDPRQPRGVGAGKAPPMTLIVSVVVLLFLIVAVAAFYRAGMRAPGEAPAVGEPVGDLKVAAPIEAQPIDPEADVTVYDEAPPVDAAVTLAPPPEQPLPREAAPVAPIASSPRPAPAKPAAAPVDQRAAPSPAPARDGQLAPAAGGTAAVQIGAFSSTTVADREYAAVAARFPEFARGAAKRVQEVTASNGSTVYRTTFTGLSRERAEAFCSALRAAGRDCIVR